MARCVSRYAVVLLLDVMRFVSSYEKLAQRGRALDCNFKLSAGFLENLMKLSENTPKISSARQLYRLLNSQLVQCGLPRIPSQAVDLAINFDVLCGSYAKAIADTKGAPEHDLLRVTQIGKLDEHIEHFLKLIDNPLHDTNEDRPIAVLWFAMMAYVGTCEQVDLIGEDEEADASARLVLHANLDRISALETGIKVLEVALNAIESLESAIVWPEPETPSRLGTMRLFLEANRAITIGLQVLPWERVGHSRITAAWQQTKAMDLWSNAQPVARTTRLLRNFIELAQYAQQEHTLLQCWELLRAADRSFCDEGLSANPRSWGGSIREDTLFCCASRLIDAYEAKIAVESMLCEETAYRQAHFPAFAIEYQIEPCQSGKCRYLGQLCKHAPD